MRAETLTRILRIRRMTLCEVSKSSGVSLYALFFIDDDFGGQKSRLLLMKMAIGHLKLQ